MVVEPDGRFGAAESSGQPRAMEGREQNCREAATTEHEEEFRYEDQGPRSRLPFARGDPIYVPDLVGPLTSLPEFKASLLQELHVDELRILKEDIEDVSGIVTQSSQPVGCPDEGRTAEHSHNSGEELVFSANWATENSNLVPCGTSNGSSIMTHDAHASEKKQLQGRRGKKRGRRFDRDCRAAELEGTYFAKVKQLAKVKQEQDENKLEARSHSFSGNLKPMEGAITTSEKIERMRSLRFVTSPAKVNPVKAQEHVPILYPAVVLCCEICHKQHNSTKTQEFLVLGSQTVTELRDNIYCLTDKLMETAGQHDPSGYFLIEDTFYNDLRNPSSIDYSEPILDWLKNCKNEAAEKWEYIMSGELKKKQEELLGNLEISNLPNFRPWTCIELDFLT